MIRTSILRPFEEGVRGTLTVLTSRIRRLRYWLALSIMGTTAVGITRQYTAVAAKPRVVGLARLVRGGARVKLLFCAFSLISHHSVREQELVHRAQSRHLSAYPPSHVYSSSRGHLLMVNNPKVAICALLLAKGYHYILGGSITKPP